ncbi:hypothetical protein FJTKL_02068 [Diaporthe vaccinii]|uniref:Uncharacterized protein n=1 Tax=Diaporthe vaccinii TaxID=105482 RepID=A0ABR4DZ61_9PEZI
MTEKTALTTSIYPESLSQPRVGMAIAGSVNANVTNTNTPLTIPAARLPDGLPAFSRCLEHEILDNDGEADEDSTGSDEEKVGGHVGAEDFVDHLCRRCCCVEQPGSTGYSAAPSTTTKPIRTVGVPGSFCGGLPLLQKMTTCV